MARVDVIMPQMGESIAEGTVSRWLKSVGDSVKRDEPILEISTDKVDAEIPSPVAGILAEIKVPEGETVEVQTVIAIIETDADASIETAAPEPAPTPAAAAPIPSPEPSASPDPTPMSAPTPLSAPPGVSSDETGDERLRRKSTPLVRKIAAEHDVDISAVSGTGHAGRVTKKDIVEYIEKGVAPSTVSQVQVAPTQAPVAGASVDRIIHPMVQAWEGDSVEPMSKIRQLTADHMVMSRRVSAHVTSFFEIDYTNLASLREAKKAEYAERGAKLTYMSFLVKAVVDNLKKHPVVNSAVSGDTQIFRKQINIGIAVALDWGLIVPVIKNADELSLLGLSKAVVDLAERARTKRLNPDEVQNGTFTITNPGALGGFVGIPIINQPQVAIMGVGTIEKRPRVITLEDGQDVIAIRTMGMISMSYDHRVVDGVNADRFLADVKHDMENFAEGSV